MKDVQRNDKARFEIDKLGTAPNHSFCDPFGRPFGRLVNALWDATRHQGRISSPWRFRVPSCSWPVGF
jgi:hypothetical protein